MNIPDVENVAETTGAMGDYSCSPSTDRDSVLSNTNKNLIAFLLLLVRLFQMGHFTNGHVAE